MDKQLIKIGVRNIPVYRINNDVNGNPRYIVHFLDLGLKKYCNIKGLKKYRGKAFGGGYVFQSYNIEDDLKYILQLIEKK